MNYYYFTNENNKQLLILREENRKHMLRIIKYDTGEFSQLHIISKTRVAEIKNDKTLKLTNRSEAEKMLSPVLRTLLPATQTSMFLQTNLFESTNNTFDI